MNETYRINEKYSLEQFKDWVKEKKPEIQKGLFSFDWNSLSVDKMWYLINHFPLQIKNMSIVHLNKMDMEQIDWVLKNGYQHQPTYHMFDHVYNNPSVLTGFLNNGYSWEEIFKDPPKEEISRIYNALHPYIKDIEITSNDGYLLHVLMMGKTGHFKELQEMIQKRDDAFIEVLMNHHFFVSDYYQEIYKKKEDVLRAHPNISQINFDQLHQLERQQQERVLAASLKEKLDIPNNGKNKKPGQVL